MRALGSIIAKSKKFNNIGVNSYKNWNETGVYPIISYGSPVMGLDRHSCLDKLLEWSMSYYVGIHKFCPIPALYGGLEWVDLSNHFKVEMIRYSNRLIIQPENVTAKQMSLNNLQH